MPITKCALISSQMVQVEHFYFRILILKATAPYVSSI